MELPVEEEEEGRVEMSELLLSSQMISYEIQIICLTSQAVQCSATQHRLPVEQRELDF